MKSDPHRSPHAALAKNGRYRKGREIERLLDLIPDSPPRRLLKIGAGSGWISHYFAHHIAGQYHVDAVDVVDSRQLKEGYRFTLVADTALPFADCTFDIVISNYVSEQVDGAQGQHLAEMRRILHLGGTGYLAATNRWMLIEPHCRLIFLSWWPCRWRTPYLRVWRKGDFYDCEPLEMLQLERMLAEAGLLGCNMCMEGLWATLEIERSSGFSTRFLARIPDALLRLFNPSNPTLVYTVVQNERQANGVH